MKTLRLRTIMSAAAVMLFALTMLFNIGCTRRAESVSIKGKITLATTTSTQDSGLLDFLLPEFTKQTGWEVDVVAVGSGAALRMGRDGDADVLLVHARNDELQFVADGYGSIRYDVMYNDFLIVGSDVNTIPHNNNVLQTLQNIASGNLPFVSRGDDSGTHRMEITLWRSAGVNPAALRNYSSVGQGMGSTLQMADEMLAYTLTDRATWLILKKEGKISLEAICENAPELLNYYGVILINPELHSHVNTEGGSAFVEWMISDTAQQLIGLYGLEEFGGALFTPNAGAE
ncbi:MAG: substrate-binding domain-containing protein [Treponema sp.]|nr:substrate-binding domain-containing protein [Treponema sp.]